MPRPLALLVLPTLLLAGCAAPTADDGVLRIAASTSVYGDIAQRVAGDDVEVTSIVTSAAQDPHSYEVTARDRLALETADLVVFNGGGYDAFVETVLDAMATEPAVVEAVAVAGLEGDEHAHEDDDGTEHEGHVHLEGVNEHVWYDVHLMADVAVEIAHALAELDPERAAAFEANADAFADELAPIAAGLEALAERVGGAGVVTTEPVPGYLLAEAGFDDVTPDGFAEAIEEGADVPPALLAEVLAVLDSGRAAIVADNAQTASSETQEIVAAAEAAGIPVVEFTETLPDGESYASWMAANVAALAEALG